LKCFGISFTDAEACRELEAVINNRAHEYVGTVDLAVWALGRQNHKGLIAYLASLLGDPAFERSVHVIERALQFLCSGEQLVPLSSTTPSITYWLEVWKGMPTTAEDWAAHDAKSALWEKRLRCATEWTAFGLYSRHLEYLQLDEVVQVRLAAGYDELPRILDRERKDAVAINDAILEVIALTRTEATNNSVSVRTQLAEGLPRVQGDRVQLQQVLLNLINNAIEAMRDVGEEERELLISTRNERDAVSVEVRDSGPGFAPAALERVFEPFYTTKPEGMGMGLSICRSIIEAHGGRLSAIQCEPQGALFQIRIPATSADGS
jgi:anti-sigma regulatory factor (Ser/Thr protein kinase)